MKLIVANSMNWFKLTEEIKLKHETIFITEKQDLTYEKVAKFSPDLIFFPHWNWIVEPNIHHNFTCVVFHTAPLPYGRGGSPIQNLILGKHVSAPVCALKMTSDLDAGPIYSKIDISLEGSLLEILEQINIVINQLIIELTTKLPTPVEQPVNSHTFTRRTERDNEIPTNINIDELYDRIRMLDAPGYPHSFIHYGNYIIKFSSASIVGNKIHAQCTIENANS